MTPVVAPTVPPTSATSPSRAARRGADDDFASALDTATAARERADRTPVRPARDESASAAEKPGKQAAEAPDPAAAETTAGPDTAAVPALAQPVAVATPGEAGAPVEGPTEMAADVAASETASPMALPAGGQAAQVATPSAASVAAAAGPTPIGPKEGGSAPAAATATAAHAPVAATAGGAVDATAADATKTAAAQPVSTQPAPPQDASPPAAPSAPDVAPAAPPAAASTPAGPAAPAAPTAPAAPAPAATPTSAAVPVPVHEQLAPRIVSLVSGGDGEHRITLRVDPDDFGPVRVVADVRGREVTVVLHAGTDQGRDALRACLSDLRRDLEASGLRGSLDLAGGSAGGGQQRPDAHAQQLPAWLGDGTAAPAVPTPPPAVRRAGGAGLDLLV